MKFTRQDNHKKPKLARSGWRRPRGIQSKMRLGLSGYKVSPNPGYGSPKTTRGKHSIGLEPVVVATPSQLVGIDKAKQAVIVSGSVGLRKAKEILKSGSTDFTLLDKELDHDDDELTATMKVRRSTIERKFGELIQGMYGR